MDAFSGKEDISDGSLLRLSKYSLFSLDPPTDAVAIFILREVVTQVSGMSAPKT